MLTAPKIMPSKDVRPSDDTNWQFIVAEAMIKVSAARAMIAIMKFRTRTSAQLC